MLRRVMGCQWGLRRRPARSIYVVLFVAFSTYGSLLLSVFEMTVQGRKLLYYCQRVKFSACIRPGFDPLHAGIIVAFSWSRGRHGLQDQEECTFAANWPSQLWSSSYRCCRENSDFFLDFARFAPPHIILSIWFCRVYFMYAAATVCLDAKENSSRSNHQRVDIGAVFSGQPTFYREIVRTTNLGTKFKKFSITPCSRHK